MMGHPWMCKVEKNRRKVQAQHHIRQITQAAFDPEKIWLQMSSMGTQFHSYEWSNSLSGRAPHITQMIPLMIFWKLHCLWRGSFTPPSQTWRGHPCRKRTLKNNPMVDLLCIGWVPRWVMGAKSDPWWLDLCRYQVLWGHKRSKKSKKPGDQSELEGSTMMTGSVWQNSQAKQVETTA